MTQESRVQKGFRNARVNLIFYILVLLITFFARRLFLERLGDEFIGLTSTLSNLIGLLNIADLGLGAAGGYMLYKPLVENDQFKVNEVVSVLGFVYRRIGSLIAAVCFIIACFLPLIIDESPFPLSLIYFTYSSYVLSALLSYYVNYRQLLLGADQRQYVVTGYYQGANILRMLLQIGILYWYHGNPFYWVGVEIFFSLIYSVILNVRIRKVYPWLAADTRSGKILLRKYPEVIRYTKQLFVHQVGNVVLFNTVPIFVYAYTSLEMVAIYTNYQIIIDKVRLLLTQLLGSADAGVGQLVAEGNHEKSLRIFWECLALWYYVAGVVIITMWFSIDPFIVNWLTEPRYILTGPVFVILVFNSFVMCSRPAVEIFLRAYGLFYDTWAPIAEAALNIGFSILGGSLWGLNGVLLGTTVSLLVIVIGWKPMFLFCKGFKSPVWHYWRVVLLSCLFIIITFFIVHLLLKIMPLPDPSSSFIHWGIYTLFVLVISSVLLFGSMYTTVPGMRWLISRLALFMRNIKKTH